MKDKQGQLNVQTECSSLAGMDGISLIQMLDWIFHCMLISVNSPNDLQISLLFNVFIHDGKRKAMTQGTMLSIKPGKCMVSML